MAPSPTAWPPTLSSPRPGWLAAASPPPAGGSIMPGPNRDFPGILPAGRCSARCQKREASGVYRRQPSPLSDDAVPPCRCRVPHRIANTDDRRRAWLASAHHDASPDTLSSQHEPCGGRGASPTRRRPTSIAALSTVTAARRQTAARCASAGHLRLVAQTCVAMLIRSRRQSSPHDAIVVVVLRSGKKSSRPQSGEEPKRALPNDPNPRRCGLAPFLLPRS